MLVYTSGVRCVGCAHFSADWPRMPLLGSNIVVGGRRRVPVRSHVELPRKQMMKSSLISFQLIVSEKKVLRENKLSTKISCFLLRLLPPTLTFFFAQR